MSFLELIFRFREFLSEINRDSLLERERVRGTRPRVINKREFFRPDRSIGRYTLDERSRRLALVPEAAEHRAALKVRLIVRDLSLRLTHKDLAIITS